MNGLLRYVPLHSLCHEISNSECSMWYCYHSCDKNCIREVAQNQNVSARRTEGRKYKKQIKQKFVLVAVRIVDRKLMIIQVVTIVPALFKRAYWWCFREFEARSCDFFQL